MQAGVAKEFIFTSMDNNAGISRDVERTFVVGMFLCWWIFLALMVVAVFSHFVLVLQG